MKQLITVLVFITASVWISVFSVDSNLHIIACDVGQGDAILIQRNKTQVLIDGGPNNSVLDCLGRHVPFWDKQIELVILTHPQEDHYGGLIDVFKSYEVLKFGEFNRNSSNESYQVLRNLVGSRSIQPLDLSKGTSIRAGLMQLDILYPYQGINELNANDSGIVTLLKYGQFKALFTADVENDVSDEISNIEELQNINYLKVNHHGSKNGLSQKLLDATDPDVAVISNAKKNSYGHPHETILKMLNDKNIKILRTDQIGDIDYVVKI